MATDTHYPGCWQVHHDCAIALVATLLAQQAMHRWIRITLRDETLPPDDLTGVEMVIVTKEDGEFLAGTTGENLRRLAASGNPKIKNYYWRLYESPEADNA